MITNAKNIAGIGVDILHLHRIKKAWEKRGLRFAQKILGTDELAVFMQRLNRSEVRGLRYLATRFAAKEAFSKAIGLGIRLPMRWVDVQLLSQASGKPHCVLSGDLKPWYQSRFGYAHVSLTDESDIVMAYVVVEALAN